MLVRVTEARQVAPFTLWLRFSDGAEGEVDLSAELDGEVFEPLRDSNVFRKFRLNPDTHTIDWDTGADFAPEFLYSMLRVRA